MSRRGEDALPITSGRQRAPRWRSGSALHVSAHRASSATLAGAYPFLVGTPMDSGPPIGVDALTGQPFCFDPWALYAKGVLSNPNVLLAGVIGQGKSALAKSLAIRSIAAGRRVYVPGDPKGEWAAVAEAVGGVVVRLGVGMPARLNPLDSGPVPARTDATISTAEWAGTVHARRLRLLAAIAETSLGRDLHPAEHAALHAALTAGVPCGEGNVLTIVDVVKALADPNLDAVAADRTTVEQRAADGRDLTHALRRLVRGDLAGLFDGPSITALDPSAPMTVLDLSRLGADDTALAIAMTCASAWLEAVLADGAQGHRWVIYDEAWRLMHALPLVRRMQAQWKLSRAHGIANLLIVHRLSDLDAVGAAGSEARAVAEGLLADCSTRIIYRQESDQLGETAKALGLTVTQRDVLPALSRGTGLWTMPGRAHVVRHDLHPEETAVVDTDAAMR